MGILVKSVSSDKKSMIIKCIIFKISALLYGSQIGNHPRHIGSIDPHCDVLEVIKGKIIAFGSTLRPPAKGAYPKIIFLFLNQNICFGYSKEPSQ